jgi:LCP family protein required for cell wall assembly
VATDQHAPPEAPAPEAPEQATPEAAAAGNGAVNGSLNGSAHRIVVYKARRPKKKRGKLKIALLTIGTLLLVAIVAAGALLYFKVLQPIQSLTDLSKNPELQRAQRSGLLSLPPADTAPVTALILGYDHRYSDGNSPSRSDTLMLVRLDPRAKTMSILSLPRDLFVTIPGHGQGKINSAYADGGVTGGPTLALQTVENLLHIPINYLIPINFRGFIQTVNTFGGAYVEVDRRYYNVNNGSAASDYANIDLQPGYQLLKGSPALAFARYRHTDSDIYRLARQQTFLREFKKRLNLTSIVTNVIDLANIAKKNVKIVTASGGAVGPEKMLSYARTVAGIPHSNIVQVRLSGDSGNNSTGGQYVYASAQQVQTAVNQFVSPDVGAGHLLSARDVGGTAVGAKQSVKRAAPAVPPARLRVLVLNGSQVAGIARETKVRLQTAGYKLANYGNLPSSGSSTPGPQYHSAIYYTSGSPAVKSSASVLQKAVLDSDLGAAPAALKSLTSQADVIVVLGTTYNGQLTLANSPSQKAPASEAASPMGPAPAYGGKYRQEQRWLGFPMLYPSQMPVGTTYGDPYFTQTGAPFRAYRITDHGKALHLTAYLSGAYGSHNTFGVQWTSWTNAPVLDSPTETRLVTGADHRQRRWQLYYNGGNLHRIAVINGGSVVWITNSLTDDLTNKTMVAIARSLRPVPGR